MPTKITFPNEIMVLHHTVSTLPHLHESFEIFKLYDATRKLFLEKAFDKNEKEVSFSEVLVKERKLKFEKYGKIHPHLFGLLEKAKSDDLFSVILWYNLPYEEPLKTSFKPGELTGSMPATIKKLRSDFAIKLSKLAKDTLSKYGAAFHTIFDYIPVVHITTTQKNLLELSRIEPVSALFLYEKDGIEDLATSMAVSHADQVVYPTGWTAKGIKVAVWEGGPDDFTFLDIEERFDPSGSDRSQHTRLVCGIIKNTEKTTPKGFAPECRLFSANNKGVEALQWAVDNKRCRVINQSFHRKAAQLSGNLTIDDFVKDYLIRHFPYPTIIQAAGNTGQSTDTANPPSSEFVNHKGFNSMTVGNHSDNARTMASSTTFRNPFSEHGDRELPEICANGSNVTAAGVTMSGTSMASPAVAGSVAILQSIHTDLLIWPEGIRAILLAGALRNVRDNTWEVDLGSVDAKDGSGALDLKTSSDIAYNLMVKNNEPAINGWAAGSIGAADFKDSMSVFSYNILVPRNGKPRVKVALAWAGKTEISVAGWMNDALSLDLDLHIFDGDLLVASSNSFDNSYEVVEYDARPGRNLTIKIRKWSGSDSSYFGIAWTVVDKDKIG